jgi:superfamily I DNA and RNA helicase
MALTLAELLSDLPQVEALVEAIKTMIAAEGTATTFAAKQKATEPVQEQLAALIDTIKGQIASP